MSAILEGILIWLAQQVLNYLLGLATKAISDASKQIKDDIERGKINDANTKAYQEAQSRADRISRALAILNGSSPSP